jgi:intein/homing endonuclease
MPNTDAYEPLSLWSETNPTLSNTSVTVSKNIEKIVGSVLIFNDGLLTSSEDHLHVVKRNSIWSVMRANDILVGDSFINQDGSEQIINSIVKNTGSFKVYKLDVESNDIYIANGIITHNKIEDIQ